LPLAHANLFTHALARIGDLSARARSLVGDKRERAARWMAARSDLSWSAPESGLFGFAVSSRADDMTSIIEHAATTRGVLVAPGSFFGIPNGFRMSWSIDEDRLAEALDTLGRVLP
jgi:aspartate/methionine/tyrosine aminotransferase